jgi:hypothetical protein
LLSFLNPHFIKISIENEKPGGENTIPILFWQIGIVDGGIEESSAGPEGPAADWSV